MGTSNSKYRPSDLTKKSSTSGSEVNIEEKISHHDMEGPSFYCAYLGFSALSKPPTNLSVLQSPVKDLYFTYRKTPASGHSANLKLVQKGVLIVLYENGSVKTEMFFDYSSVTFVEAAKFSPVKTSSERKPKALFVPVDESKGGVSEKNAFLVDKNFHFLISSTHPPLVVCVVRRPTGVKALDCHVFALDTIENCLHISALIASAQLPSGHVNKIDTSGDGGSKVKGGFDRGVRGDVIRSDYTDYSVYRGPHGYEMPPIQQFGGGPVSEQQQGQWYGGSPLQSLGGPTQNPGSHPQSPGGAPQSPYSPIHSPGRNGHSRPPSGGLPGPMMLTQDNFRDHAAPSESFGGAPGPKAYGIYEQPNYGTPGVAYFRQPDVIMHTRQRSGDQSQQRDQIFSGAIDSNPGAVRMRYDEVAMRNNANSRLSAGSGNEVRLSGGQDASLNRLSAGQGLPSGKISPRPHEMPTSGHIPGSQFSQWTSDPMSSPVSPMSHMNSPRSPFTPGSPRGFDPKEGSGPVYSASNLESRNPQTDLEEHVSGRPVAKVPPHMIGVKVLPSDFRMVKLKPKTDKRPDPSDSDTNPYDNNKELGGKLRELPINKAKNLTDGDGFQEFDTSKGRHEEYSRDYASHWNDDGQNSERLGGGITGRFNDSSNAYRHDTSREYSARYEDNNNKNRYTGPSYGDDRNWEPQLNTTYNTGSIPSASNDPYSRTKDREIANMFSNVRIQPNNAPPMYRQPRDRNEIEDGLGYLP